MPLGRDPRLNRYKGRRPVRAEKLLVRRANDPVGRGSGEMTNIGGGPLTVTE